MNQLLRPFLYLLALLCFTQAKAQNHLNVHAAYIFPAKFYFQGYPSYPPKYTGGGWQTGVFCEHEFVTGRFGIVMSTRMRLGIGLSVQHQRLTFSTVSGYPAPPAISCEPDEHTIGLRELHIPLRARFYLQKHTWWSFHVSAAMAFRIPLSSKAYLAQYTTGAEYSGQTLSPVSGGQFAFPLSIGYTRIYSNTQVSLDAGYNLLSGSYHYTGEKNHGWAMDQLIRIKGIFSLSLGFCIL